MSQTGRGRHGNHFKGTKPTTKFISFICNNCSQEFKIKDCEVRVRGFESIKFCSRKCAFEYKSIIKKCLICGKIVNETRHDYCSPECASIAKRKPDSMWNKRTDETRLYYRNYGRNNPEIIRKWYSKNKDASRKIKRRWAANNKDKITVRHRKRMTAYQMNRLTAKDWHDCKVLFNFNCASCGRMLPLTIDHIVPISLAGKHEKGNIQPLCKSCNSKKNTKIIDYRFKRMIPEFCNSE